MKSNLHAQSEVVEEALKEFFEKHNVKIEDYPSKRTREVQAMARCNDQHAVDLDTYISKNGRFKFFVYDRREIQTIANNLGLKTDLVRTELKKMGYYLIKTNNGQMVWKRDGVSI